MSTEKFIFLFLGESLFLSISNTFNSSVNKFFVRTIILSVMRNTKEKKHLSKGKKALIQYSIIVVVAITVGITAGVVLKKKLGPVETDYTGFNPEAFRMDSKALVKEYEANKNKNFTPAELVNIGLEKYRSCENSYSIGVGLADTIVKQTIRNFQIRNGDQYFEEQISKSSMVSLANRAHQVSDDKVNVYKGKAKDTEVSEYSDNKKEYNLEGFKESWGKTLPEMFIYLICEDTVLDEGTSITKKDGTIRVELNLDPEIASYYYKLQMQSLSELSALPTFEYLRQTYIFDNDMNLLHSIFDEKYQATMSGITATIVNNLDYYYHANEFIKIPDLGETLNYSVEGEPHYE